MGVSRTVQKLLQIVYGNHACMARCLAEHTPILKHGSNSGNFNVSVNICLLQGITCENAYRYFMEQKFVDGHAVRVWLGKIENLAAGLGLYHHLSLPTLSVPLLPTQSFMDCLTMKPQEN